MIAAANIVKFRNHSKESGADGPDAEGNIQ